MATLSILTSQTMARGASLSASRVLATGVELVAIDISAARPFATPTSEVNLVIVVKDAEGHVVASSRLQAPGVSRMLCQGFADQTGFLEVMNLGDPVIIQVDQITGIEAAGGSLTLDADDIADASLLTAKFGPGAVTPAKLSGFNLIKCLAFVGAAAPGPCACVGAAVGDRVIAMWGATTAAGAGLVAIPNNGTIFESVITVVDQVQQIQVADWSLTTLVVLLAPAAA